MIKLSIGLGYIHYGLKRQAENRQYHIAQGLSFLQDYYQSRRLSHSAEERREASYNLGRTYHMLGLTHLAVPYYMEVLECREGRVNDNLWADTAYNLRTIYAMGGNAQMAMEVTAELGCI
jgi:general transcription factor 3C polypeptide 3 (transcription factor C subunit 4)